MRFRVGCDLCGRLSRSGAVDAVHADAMAQAMGWLVDRSSGRSRHFCTECAVVAPVAITLAVCLGATERP